MKFQKLSLISYISIFIFFIPHNIAAKPNAEKTLEFIDKIYDKNIKTAILFQANDIKATPLNSPAIPIFQKIPLVL